MSDKELADKVVALGVAEYDATLPNWPAYSMRNPNGSWDYFEDELLVRDWRVAGALMEKCQKMVEALTGTGVAQSDD